MGPHGLHELHMGLGDPIWVHMGFIGCACRSRWRANIVRSASFGLPDLAARTGCGDKTAHRPPPEDFNRRDYLSSSRSSRRLEGIPKLEPILKSGPDH